MNNKIVALLVCLGLVAASQSHAAERIEAWGQGVSEFEAVKSAYKQIFAKSLKTSVGGAGTSGTSLRQNLTREIEEDLQRVQSTYFPGAAPPECREENERYQCLVVARVEMDEIEAKVASMFSTTGSGKGSVGALRYALMAREATTQQKDLVVWLHRKLEGDLRHDVYLANDYVDAEALRGDCKDYREKATEFEARGDNFQKTAQSYRRAFQTCNDLKDRDLIIVLDSVESTQAAYSARDRSLQGEIRLRMQILQTQTRRPLVAPRPQAINKFGYGDTPQLAESNLRDQMYESAANFISQQMNEAAVKWAEDGKVASLSAERDYKVAIGGVNPDTDLGQKQIRLVQDWFAGEGSHALDADFTQGTFGERIYSFRDDRPPNWGTMTEQLRAAILKAGLYARLDVDPSLNLTVAFQNLSPKDDQALVTMKVEDKRIKRTVVVEAKSMEVRRRDPESGVAIAVNEAVLRIRNKSGKDLLVDVTPVWTGQDGSSLPAPYSYRQTLRLPAKTSERFAFMAPSKFAGAVSIEIACPVKACKIVE